MSICGELVIRAIVSCSALLDHSVLCYEICGELSGLCQKLSLYFGALHKLVHTGTSCVLVILVSECDSGCGEVCCHELFTYFHYIWSWTFPSIHLFTWSWPLITVLAFFCFVFIWCKTALQLTYAYACIDSLNFIAKALLTVHKLYVHVSLCGVLCGVHVIEFFDQYICVHFSMVFIFLNIWAMQI